MPDDPIDELRGLHDRTNRTVGRADKVVAYRSALAGETGDTTNLVGRREATQREIIEDMKKIIRQQSEMLRRFDITIREILRQ